VFIITERVNKRHVSDTINLYDRLLDDLLTVAASTAEQPYNIISAAVICKMIYLFFSGAPLS